MQRPRNEKCGVWSRDVAEHPRLLAAAPAAARITIRLTCQTESFRTQHQSIRSEPANKNFTAEPLHERLFADPAPESTMIGFQADKICWQK